MAQFVDGNLAIASALPAQRLPNGALQVAIHDAEGEAVPGATVTLQTPPGNLPPGGRLAPRSTRSDDAGKAHFSGIAPGGIPADHSGERL